jgi:hypothetical protein
VPPKKIGQNTDGMTCTREKVEISEYVGGNPILWNWKKDI